MSLGGLLVVETPVLTSVSASSLPGALFPQKGFRTRTSDLRW